MCKSIMTFFAFFSEGKEPCKNIILWRDRSKLCPNVVLEIFERILNSLFAI